MVNTLNIAHEPTNEKRKLSPEQQLDILAEALGCAHDEVFFENYCSTLKDNQEALDFVAQLNVRQLQHQSRLLLHKRWSHVQSLIPETILLLGDQGLNYFRAYALHPTQTNSDFHTHDAYEFMHFLKRVGIGVFQPEMNRLAFILSKKRFSIHYLKPARFQFLIQTKTWGLIEWLR